MRVGVVDVGRVFRCNTSPLNPPKGEFDYVLFINSRSVNCSFTPYDFRISDCFLENNFHSSPLYWRGAGGEACSPLYWRGVGGEALSPQIIPKAQLLKSFPLLVQNIVMFFIFFHDRFSYIIKNEIVFRFNISKAIVERKIGP